MYNRRDRKQYQSLSECMEILKRCQSELQGSNSEYSFDSVAIFGSVARKQNHRKSDIDILMHFSALPSLFELVRIESFLAKKLNMRVDLVVENGINPEFVARTSKDIVRI